MITGTWGSIRWARPSAVAQPAAELEARGVGQHHVEQHQVAVLDLEQVERLAGARGGDHLVAVGLQVVGEERARRVVVLDDHDRVAGQGHHLRGNRVGAFPG